MFICLFDENLFLELSNFNFCRRSLLGLFQVNLRLLSGHSQVSYQLFLSALLAYFVGQTEPKILFLVNDYIPEQVTFGP